jgi:hypothetical protein
MLKVKCRADGREEVCMQRREKVWRVVDIYKFLERWRVVDILRFLEKIKKIPCKSSKGGAL